MDAPTRSEWSRQPAPLNAPTLARLERPGGPRVTLGPVIRGCPLALVVALTLGSALAALRAPPSVWVDTLFDDAYYYLGIARHLSLGHGSMFAAPLQTNGYQPLWLLIMTAISFVVGGDRVALAAAMHVTILLLVIGFAIVAWRQEGRHWPAAVTALCFPTVMLEGMETVLIPPLALLYFRADGWTRGALASLIFLARLDALGLVAGRELYELVSKRRVDVRAAVVLAATIVTYAAVNLHLFGIPVPVSGLAKAIGNVRGENWQTGLELGEKAVPVLLALVFAWWARRHFRNPLPIFAAAFALVCSAIYYGLFSGWPTWEWYAWPVALLFYFALNELAVAIPSRRLNAACMLLLILSVFPVRDYVWRFHFDQRHQQTWGQANAAMTAAINRSRARTATFAMGDRAGSFGYFLDDRFRLIQTEGLVADTHYLTALKEDRADRFLDAARTDYFVVDRGQYWLDQGRYAIPEPIQGISARSGLMLLCFPADAFIGSVQLRPQRKVLDYRKRIPCPPSASALFRQRRQLYSGIRSTSI